MPYMGGTRETVSDAMPFMTTSHTTIYGHAWTKKGGGEVALSKIGGSRQGHPPLHALHGQEESSAATPYATVYSPTCYDAWSSKSGRSVEKYRTHNRTVEVFHCLLTGSNTQPVGASPSNFATWWKKSASDASQPRPNVDNLLVKPHPGRLLASSSTWLSVAEVPYMGMKMKRV